MEPHQFPTPSATTNATVQVGYAYGIPPEIYHSNRAACHRRIWLWFKDAVKNNWKALFWMIGAIISMVGQTVYLKQSANKMPAFPYFIFWFTVIPFVVVFFTFYWLCLLLGVVSKEQRKVPQYIYVVIGTLTTLNGVFMLFSNPHVPGVMQALLGPTVVTIPMSMVLSLIIICRCFRWQQFIAVAVILGGLVIALYPSISGHSAKNTGPIGWNVLFFLGSVPGTLAAVYEEKVLHNRPVHIAHLLAWSTLYQAITIFLSFPLDIIPDFGSSDGSMTKFGDNQWAALKCFFGQSIDDVCPECDCGMAWLPISLFTLFYVLTNFTQLGVIQFGNAALYYVVSTLSLPLSEFAFASPLLGSNRESINMFQYISLAVLIVGVVLYRLFDAPKRSSTLEEVLTDSEEDLLLPKSMAFGSGLGGATRRVKSMGVAAFPGYSQVHVQLYEKDLGVKDDQEEGEAMENDKARRDFWTI